MMSATRSFLIALFLAVMLSVSGTDLPSTNSVLLRRGDAVGPTIDLVRRPNEIELNWPATLISKENGKIRPYYEVQQSFDLVRWETVERIPDTANDLIGGKRQSRLTLNTRAAFYRIVATSFTLEGSERVAPLGVGGEEVFGYSDLFARELASIGQITPEQLAALYPAPTNYVAQISFDPTKAKYWAEFNGQIKANTNSPSPCPPRVDLRMNAAELAIFKTNGFVVSERLRGYSFADVFYRLWINDLPVFISADSILQAWHRSYDMMLQEMEELCLVESLQQILDGMASKIKDAASTAGTGALRESVSDADYLITVARSLLSGSAAESALGQSVRVQKTLGAIAGLGFDPCFPLFGRPRAMDFSQFKIRGHYEETERLGRYFKSVMWLGRTDLRVAGRDIADSDCEGPHDADPRELGTSVVLTRLLIDSGQFERWRQFDQILQAFVGWTDSLTFAQLSDLLMAAGVKSLSDLPDFASLTNLQRAIERGQYGVQQIRSDYFISPLGSSQIRLPRSFTMFGQKFVLDSWALSKVVFDDIRWADNGNTNEVMRRVPSCLDVAFSVLGNDQTVPDLVQRITDQSDTRNPQRDGLFYQHNLAALRRVMDRQDWDAVNNSIYVDWLATLRPLSRTFTSDLKYPEVFRTRAWAMKTLNTQMASWTQLRHDTILYAKQSYTGSLVCSFPDGYVEPVPSFWFRLRLMAERTQKLIANLNLEGKGTLFVRSASPFPPMMTTMNLKEMQQNQVTFLKRFADIVFRLEGIALHQMAGQPLTTDDHNFIAAMLENNGPISCAYFIRLFTGWYPSLFYRPAYVATNFDTDYGSDRMDALIADVHTDLPCAACNPSDPGSVLHEAVGEANLLLIAVPRGDEVVMFGGPVFSHFEFEFLGEPTRWSDSQWKAKVRSFDSNVPSTRPKWRGTGITRMPVPPSWTSSYLVPSP